MMMRMVIILTFHFLRRTSFHDSSVLRIVIVHLRMRRRSIVSILLLVIIVIVIIRGQRRRNIVRAMVMVRVRWRMRIAPVIVMIGRWMVMLSSLRLMLIHVTWLKWLCGWRLLIALE